MATDSCMAGGNAAEVTVASTSKSPDSDQLENKSGKDDTQNISSNPPVRIPSRSTVSVSLSDVISQQQPINPVAVEVKPLTQELLQQIWDSYIENHKDDTRLVEAMKERKLIVKDENLFEVVLPSGYYEKDYKVFQTDLLEYMRRQTGHVQLQMKMLVDAPQHEAKAYTPKDKYEAMLKMNSELARFRILFSEIDF